MKVDNTNTKIFHSIIKDLSNMVEALRVENENMNDLILENQKLNNKIKEYESSIHFKNLLLYFLSSSLSIYLFSLL